MITAPVKEIHQIEITNRCNLACVYCPHPGMQREKVDMDWGTYLASLEVVKYYMDQGTQGELSLTGVGEALLHPQFVEMLHLARNILGPHRPLVFATNGLLLDDAMCERIKLATPLVYVSMHRPEKAAKAINALKRHGIEHGTNDSFATSAYDWAGQVNWYNSGPKFDCAYLSKGWAAVLSDGRVSTCCWDAHGQNIIGHVKDELGSLRMRTFPLCDQCHHSIPQHFKEV